tara:strand:- start:2313 stop:2954 length:642 start_codon:yes stop_codon:yes gene_type:complete
MSPSPKRGISIFPSFDGNMPEERLSRSSLTKDTFQAFVFIVQNFYRNQYQWEYNSPITYEKKEWRMILQVSHYLLSRTKNSIIALYAGFFIVSGVILQETTEDNVVLRDLEKISRHAEYFAKSLYSKGKIGTGQARIIESLVLTDAQINETKALALTGAIQGSTGDRIRRFLLPVPNKTRYLRFDGPNLGNPELLLKNYLTKTLVELRHDLLR